MKVVKVVSAKAMAKKHEAVGCIVLCIDQDSRMNMASYGTNKHNCDEMGKMLRIIGHRYDQGYLGVPHFEEGRRSKFPVEENNG